MKKKAGWDFILDFSWIVDITLVLLISKTVSWTDTY